jgi:hypothetical protein
VIERRDILRGAAVTVSLLSAQAVSACSLATFEADTWGQKLIRFLKDGDASILTELFKDHSTLVAFDSTLLNDGEQLSYAGAEEVRNALIGFRKVMTSEGIAGTPPSLQIAKIIGSEQQGRMNKIELFFAESTRVDTSCGPLRSEHAVDLYYRAGVHETGDDWVKWSIERVALIPRLELEKFNG